MVGRRWFSQSRREASAPAETDQSRPASVHNEAAEAGDAAAAASEDSASDEDSVLKGPTTKLKQLFRKRSEDLFIELEEPHRVYSPGDAVRGRVILILKNDTKTLFTRLHFQGQVRLGSGKQVTKSNLFREHLNLWGTKTSKGQDDGGSHVLPDEQDVDTQSQMAAGTRTDAVDDGRECRDKNNDSWEVGTLCAGRHVFEFEFLFPNHSLPSSVDFGRGSVAYFLRCDHQKPGNLTSRGRSSFRKDLSVLDSIDIGSLPPPKKRVIEPDTKSKRKEGAGRVYAVVELARAGYLKGETISLNISLQHIKPIKNMSGTIATLYRLSRFDSRDVAPQSFRKDLSQVVLPILVDPGSLDYKVSPRLRVPSDVFPTIKAAGPVSFRYFVEVVLDLNGRTTVWQAGPSLQTSDSHTASDLSSSMHTLDTDAIKREKGTHCVVFEVIIGTKLSPVVLPVHSNSQLSTGGTYEPSMTDLSVDTPLLRPDESQPYLNNHYTATREDQPDTYAAAAAQFGRESQTTYPLSKSALQAMEAALVPSMPPDEDANSNLDNFAARASCPPANLLMEEPGSSEQDGPSLHRHDEFMPRVFHAPEHQQQHYISSSPPPTDENDNHPHQHQAIPSAPPLALFEQLENGLLPAYHNSSATTRH